MVLYYWQIVLRLEINAFSPKQLIDFKVTRFTKKGLQSRSATASLLIKSD